MKNFLKVLLVGSVFYPVVVAAGLYDRVAVSSYPNADGSFTMQIVPEGGNVAEVSARLTAEAKAAAMEPLKELAGSATESISESVKPATGTITSQQLSTLAGTDVSGAVGVSLDDYGMKFTKALDGNWVQTSGPKLVSTPGASVESIGQMKYSGAGNYIGTEVKLSTGETVLLKDVNNLNPGDKISMVNGNYTKLPSGSVVAGDSVVATTGDTFDGLKGTQFEVESVNPDGTVTIKDVDGNQLTVKSEAVTDAASASEAESAASAKPSEQLAAEQKGEAEGKTGEAKDKAKEAKSPIDTANVTNAIQYAILILQSVEGMNQEDATREVTVKGAEKLKDSQGESAGSTIATGTTLDGSTISCAANSMAYVLQNNTVDLGLLDLSEFDLSVKREHDVARSNRDLLLQQYGVSAQVIAEASNSISSQFYERTSALTEAAGTTSGSLGAASVVNDSERYPYFEMVRQAALSAVQLGLKGASILPDIQIINVNAAERDSNDDS